MKKWIIIIAIIIVLLAVGGYFAKKQLDKAMKYCYKYDISKSKINKVSAKEINIDFAIDFKNNSDIEAQINGYTFDVVINDLKVSKLSSKAKISIKPASFTTIIVPIKLDLSGLNGISLGPIIKYMVTDRSKVMITVKGVVSGGALGINIDDMPIEISMSLAEIMKPSTEPETECK